MNKRLAITISGAVSLGSYEAGVMFEICEAIAQHNASSDGADLIKIDVMSAASAGAMTAAIACQKLLYDGSALSGSRNNCLYEPWVKDVGIDALLQLQATEDPGKSILSSDLIERISKRYLLARYQDTPSTSGLSRSRHPAAADSISLGLAISNLNGVNDTQPLQTEGVFTYTRHADQVRRVFSADGSDGNDRKGPWEFVRAAAVASGAFPFAFRVRELLRDQAEYPGADHFKDTLQLFAYTDGGVFENEPLGMAKDLVDEIDQHLNTESRFYLFVAPGARTGTQDTDFHERDANLLATGKRLAASIFEQARFHDWVMAEKVNAKINLLNERAKELVEGFKTGAFGAAILQPAAGSILDALFAKPGPETRGNAWQRLKSQYSEEYGEVLAAVGNGPADAFIDCLLVLETAAELGDKEEMMIYGITAADSELASSGVSAFAGFFDERYRQHDYDVGRKKAREFLTDPKLSQAGHLGPIRYSNPEPLHAIDPSLDGLTLDRMERSVREGFRERLRDRAHSLMKELGVPTALLRESIDLTVIKPQLNRLLKL